MSDRAETNNSPTAHNTLKEFYPRGYQPVRIDPADSFSWGYFTGDAMCFPASADHDPVEGERLVALLPSTGWTGARYVCAAATGHPDVPGWDHIVEVETPSGQVQYRVSRACLRSLAEAERLGINCEADEPDYPEYEKDCGVF